MLKTIQNKTAVLVFVLPSIILFSLVVSFPIFNTFYRSFFDWDGLGTPIFNGIDNYIRLFDDDLFYISLGNGLKYSLVLVFYQIGISSLFAYIFSLKYIRMKKIFRTTLFIPVVLSVTVVSQLWLSILNGEYGLFNKLMEVFGWEYQQNWMSEQKSAIFAVAFVDSWHNMGYYLILIYTAMKSVPEHYYDAADIDGANSFVRFFRITIPMILDTYKLGLVLTITGGLKAFSTMFILTNGGPGTATFTLTYLMYRSLFRINHFGYACATAVMLLIICLIITILVNRLLKQDTLY